MQDKTEHKQILSRARAPNPDNARHVTHAIATVTSFLTLRFFPQTLLLAFENNLITIRPFWYDKHLRNALVTI